MTQIIDVAGAISAAAAKWEYSAGRPEHALGDALTAALHDICEVEAIEAGRMTFPVPDWQPAPRGIDLYVPNEAGLPQLLFELKVEAIHEVLYDLLKLAAQLGVGVGVTPFPLTPRC